MAKLGLILSAFAFGAAVGFLNNAISGWLLRRAAGGKRTAGAEEPPAGNQAPAGERPPGTGFPVSWTSLLALQYVLRIALSLVSLYVTYRIAAGDAGAILANLAGLFLARYWLLWRLGR